MDSFHVAFAAEDTARLGRLISDDSSMVFYGTSASELQRGRAAFLAKHQAQDWAQLDSISFTAPADVNAQVSGDQALITYHTQLGFVAGGQAGSLPLRMTLSFHREGGTWRIRQGAAAEVGGD
ncbi:MAG: nuclear transport factor 2 family protein [Gemmatimonadetes bacterium]|nr:nuclear transport factor 2 family protein [Gemmatimonadota bacterium]HRY09952.1 nuclear transport factor 2 family protein [Candidatus Nanopelagicales bacterium]